MRFQREVSELQVQAQKRISSYESIEARFGNQVVSFDPSDVGSNREAASQNYTVVTGGNNHASLCTESVEEPILV
jgi:hypothetical protein